MNTINMLSKRLPASVLICVAFLLYSCSHNLAPVGHYQSDPVIIDGNINDWVLPLRFSNPEYTMHYSVTNDDKNIYVCVISKSPTYQRRMLRSGLNIYFDTKGEKNKTCALVFPVRKTSEPSDMASLNSTHAADHPTTIAQLILQSDYYNTIGFTNMENGQYDLKATQTDIRIAMKQDADSSLVYEAAIPIRYVLGKDFSSGQEAKNFSVGITLNATGANPGNRGNTGRPYHGGNSMSGQRGMGGSHHYPQNNGTTQKPEETWYTFRLAYKNSN